MLPQLGLETSKTMVSLNEKDAFSPLGGTVSPQAALRFDYAFKKGHGPFLGLATSRSVVEYRFADPETGTTAYTASRGSTQLRLEGGYQVTTKRLYFKKATAPKSTATSHYKTNGMGCSRSVAHSGCGSKTRMAAPPVDKRTWVRIQPALGMAYIPNTATSEIQKTVQDDGQSVYAYNAGNWTTGVISGVGFVFGKGAESKYMVSLNYVKGLGNLDTRSLTTMYGNKPITTSMQSTAASWSLRMGIPINFAKKPAAAKSQPVKKPYSQEHKCGQYKSHCSRSVM